MEHYSPTLLFRLACEYLISARVIRPGPVTAVERVAHAREVDFFGAIEVDIEGELAQLGPTGYRPLRVRDTLF